MSQPEQPSSKTPFATAMPGSDSPVTQQEIVSAINHHARELARLTATWPAVEPKPQPSNLNIGHGHVFPRPDGVRARCGGPGLCSECSQDLTRKTSQDDISEVGRLRIGIEEICQERATSPMTRARLRNLAAGVDWRKAK